MDAIVIAGGIPQPEVRPLVDDRDASGQEVRDSQRGGAVGQGKEDRIGVAVELALEGQLGGGEVGMDGPDRVAPPLAPGQPDEFDGRVRSEEPDELAPDVAGRADDADADGGADGQAGRREGGRSGVEVGRACHGRMTIHIPA